MGKECDTDRVVFSRGQQDRLKKLARKLDSVAAEDLLRMERERQAQETRKKAAAQLHGLCAEFVLAMNRLVDAVHLELTPEEFQSDGLSETHVYLFQLSVSGRVIQFTFRGTAELEATEELRVPYTMEGSVRWFNQEMLERDDIKEHRLYYCLDKSGNEWRYVDAPAHRMKPVHEEYIAGLVEQLI